MDALGSLIVRKGKGGKKIMIAAHMDEIGLVATHIDEKGFVRFTNIGGGVRNNIAAIRPDLANEYLRRLIALRDGLGAKPPLPTSNSWQKELEVVGPVMTIPAVPTAGAATLAAAAASDTTFSSAAT